MNINKPVIICWRSTLRPCEQGQQGSLGLVDTACVDNGQHAPTHCSMQMTLLIEYNVPAAF